MDIYRTHGFTWFPNRGSGSELKVSCHAAEPRPLLSTSFIIFEGTSWQTCLCYWSSLKKLRNVSPRVRSFHQQLLYASRERDIQGLGDYSRYWTLQVPPLADPRTSRTGVLWVVFPLGTRVFYKVKLYNFHQWNIWSFLPQQRTRRVPLVNYILFVYNNILGI